MAQKNESPFVGELQLLINKVLEKPFELKRGKKLEYQSAFSDKSEFETDLCIVDGDGKPRVVFELKTSPTTHDVMIYSQKADDHKRQSPQIVYGMIASTGNVVAKKLWKHNRHMDFAIYLEGLSNEQISMLMSDRIKAYVAESLLREEIANGKSDFRGFFYKTETLAG